MAKRTFSVYFSKPSIGQSGDPLVQHLRGAVATHGKNLPVVVVDNERFQMRAVKLVGSVWQGVFAKLRDDTPNYVDSLDEERELALAHGSSIIEKGVFLYREQGNVLVWQICRSGGSMSKAAAYLGAVLNTAVLLPHVQNQAQLEDMLNNNLYEIDMQYAQPSSLPMGVNPWSQRAFDIAGAVGASYARFTMRARRGKTLAADASDFVKEMLGLKAYRRIKVRISEDSDPVKLFLAPLKEEFTIEVVGRYPDTTLVLQGLEDAYTRQQAHIASNSIN